MKKCTYCGRKNEDANAYCRECGVPFEEDSPLRQDYWHSLSLIPRSAEAWTRSFALPLFIACVVIWIWAFAEGFDHDRMWHYAGPAIAGGLLPLLGVALGLTCFFGKGLHKAFLIFAWIAALMSVFGVLLAPALAE